MFVTNPCVVILIPAFSIIKKADETPPQKKKKKKKKNLWQHYS
jgi:hypothetical protein